VSTYVEFTLTEDHIKLLRRTYVYEDLSTYEYGAAWVNPKRPYGNSDVEEDIIDILGWPVQDEDDERAAAAKVHSETPIALQIVLSTGTFTPGVYRRPLYNTREWKLVSE
jgi:hypothetical protein